MQDSEDQTTGGGDTAQQDGAAANGLPETPKKPTSRKKASSAADTGNTGDAEKAPQDAGTGTAQGDQPSTVESASDDTSPSTAQTDTNSGVGNAQGRADTAQVATNAQTDQASANTAQSDGIGEAGSGDTSGGLDAQGGDSPIQDVAAPSGSAEATLEQGGDTQYQYSHEENYPFFGSASEAGAALTDTPKDDQAATPQPKESGVIKVYNKGRIKIEPITKIRLGSLVATDIPFKTAAERDQILASIKSLNQLKNTLTTQVVED